MECPHCEGQLGPDCDSKYCKKCAITLSPEPSSSEIQRYQVRRKGLRPVPGPGHYLIVPGIIGSVYNISASLGEMFFLSFFFNIGITQTPKPRIRGGGANLHYLFNLFLIHLSDLRGKWAF